MGTGREGRWGGPLPQQGHRVVTVALTRTSSIQVLFTRLFPDYFDTKLKISQVTTEIVLTRSLF
jgi:hypothetical protein